MIRILLHSLAVVVLSLSSLACNVAESGSLSLKQDTVGVGSGEVFLSVMSDEAWTLQVDYLGDQRDWLSLSRTSGTGTLNSIILFYQQNKDMADRQARIVVNFSNSTRSVTFTQKGLASLKEGGEGTVLPTWKDYPDLKSEVLPGWMELPAVSSIEGCAWVHHDMVIPQYSGRNYSIFYDAANFMPRWVAYPLTPGLAGNGARTEKWNQWDPKIPREYQPETQDYWGVSGYDRGHMVPSADRVATDAANWQTFYPTNMVVQKGRKLNQRIWGNLEGQVRTWSASCDTLYVVTGAVPSKEYITDKGGNRVNKPAAFYKVLLQYKKNVSVSETYVGIAFYLENRDYEESNVDRSMAMSVSALESKLGINFFVNLPDRYSVYAEQRVDPAHWGIK